MSVLKAPESGVTVRMYRQGLGDCFLLAFPADKQGEAYYVLVDCGVVWKAPDAEVNVRSVVENIRQATGGDIHLLVITHEHWDHVSGFTQAAAEFEGIRVHNLWLAWTEDPTDELAQSLRTRFEKELTALRALVGRAAGANGDSAAHIANLLRFFGDPSAAPAAGDGAFGFSVNTRIALDAAKELVRRTGGEPECRRPGEGPLPLPKVADVGGVPGAQLYVLGPPHCWDQLRRVNPRVKAGEVYAEENALAADPAFWAAVGDGLGEASAEDEKALRARYPFDRRVRVSAEEARRHEFFEKHYGFDDEGAEGAGETRPTRPGQERWRRIDDAWLASPAAEDLALQLDSYTNNTTLVLAIELAKSRKVLLFVGDAQVGNWLSWQGLTWTVPAERGGTETVKAEDLLKRTALYKVGHHGSSNATVPGSGGVKWGLELMEDEGLMALLPVDQETAKKVGWDEMPYEPILCRLRQRAKGRIVRQDRGLPSERPPEVDESTWEAFLSSVTSHELYFEVTVADRPSG